MTALHIWYAVNLSSIVAAACIAYAMFDVVGASHAFAWHPVLMTLAFLVFMSHGMNHYFAGQLEGVDRSSSRKSHAIYQIIAVLLTIGGWIAIFVAHSGPGKSHTGSGAPFVKWLHVWIGYAVILGVVFQGAVGLSKYCSLPKNFAKWHGDIGTPVWFLGCLNIFLGVCFWFFTSTAVQVITAVCVLTTVGMTLLLRTLAKSKTTEQNYTPVQTTGQHA